MARRNGVPDAVQAEVLVLSRRRCSICFGLHRDESIKKGQIAHLDQNRDNNSPLNLTFLCLEHHDEYDGKTSQSKGLTIEEVRRYRDELHQHFGGWRLQGWDPLLNYLRASITIDQMTDTAVRIAGTQVFYGEEHAYDVLVSKKKDYSDFDLLTPHLLVLDEYASWGWLTFTEEQGDEDEYGSVRTYLTVQHGDVCRRIADVIRKRIHDRGESEDQLDILDALANTFSDDPP